MKYTNPVIRGMYPDPSICCVDGIYYLVNSTFEYFPGVPIFKSKDLVNWEQIGNCIVDSAQIGLLDCPDSGGIFAPTLRFHNGKFYMITTCFGNKGMKNFFMTAEDPAGEWSAPIFIDIDGIDPSIYWEDGQTYIQYTSFGKINQMTINESDGSIIEASRLITNGCGGRDTEGPHMWKRNGFYYLLLAEGGTREGHMVTLMRSESVWGPFEASPYLPVVSNKDYSKEPLQCVGHADWITDEKGNDYLVALAARHIKHKTILGRETVLTPAYWTEDGWLRAKNPYIPVEDETPFEGEQIRTYHFNLDMNQKEIPMQMLSLRTRHQDLIELKNHSLYMTGNDDTLIEGKSPMILALRQSEYTFTMRAQIIFEASDRLHEAGILMYTDSEHHFSLFLSSRVRENGEKDNVIIFRKHIDDITLEQVICVENKIKADLMIKGDKEKYYFYYSTDDEPMVEAGWTYHKHLASSCVASPNTGVVGGMYVVGKDKARFTQFSYEEDCKECRI